VSLLQNSPSKMIYWLKSQEKKGPDPSWC